MSDDDRDDIESDADKRAHHNALERKRRDHIKDSFTSLKDTLPAFQGDHKSRASRAQILKKAADYILSMRRKNQRHEKDIHELGRQNNQIELEIRKLEQNKTTGNIAAAAAVLETKYFSHMEDSSMYEQEAESESDDTSDSDGSVEEEDDFSPSPKRVKVNNY